MIENIGKVKLNLEYYSGKDLYSDGAIEDELLEIVSKYKEEDFDAVIRERNSWPVLYHLSDMRQNIVTWYPFKEKSNILEVGAGCGAITGALTEMAERVVALDLSKRRSTINARRNKEKSNLEILVGNFNHIQGGIQERFDYVTLIGVFEYAESYIDGDNPKEIFLEKVNGLLKEDGKILIAIENRFGLKYFAGCREDHLSLFGEGISGYGSAKGVRTLNRSEWIKLLDKCGFKDYKIYYPYPDYKFPTTIYSDSYMPKAGELTNNIRNFDGDRIMLFDETKAFDSIIEAGSFGEYSNSFFIEVSRKES